MDVLGIETRPEAWSVVHMKSSAFKVNVERFMSFTGISFDDKVNELKDYIRERRLKNVRIAVGLPRESSLSMVLNIPAPKAEAIEGILGYELEKHLPCDPDEVCHGFQILKKEDKVFSILLAASQKGIIKGIVDNLDSAGLNPSCVTTWHASLFNALDYSKNLSPLKNVAFIGMNNKSMTLDIFSDLMPVYSKSLGMDEVDEGPLASRDVIERELKRSVLSLAGPVEKRRLDEGIFISEKEPDEEFLRELSSQMSMPVSAQSLKELGLPSSAAIALGAALCDLGKGRMKINFATGPGAVKKSPLYLNNAVLSGIVLALAIATGSSYLLKDRVTMSGLEAAMADVRTQKAAVQSLTDKEHALTEKVDTLTGLKAPEAAGPLDVLKNLTRLLPRDTWLTAIDYSGDSISIEGYSKRASALLMKMEKSSFMTDFEFAGPVSRTPDGKERFRMNIKLKASSHGAKDGRVSK